VLNSAVIKKQILTLYPKAKHQWPHVIDDCLFQYQPECYRNHRLEYGWPGSDAKGSLLRPNLRRDAMNYLCNQLINGTVTPSGPLAPYFAFLPDNYFLRAEHLIPIYIVRQFDMSSAFIEFPTPKRRTWERFLKETGFEEVRGGKGDHEKWWSPRTNKKL